MTDSEKSGPSELFPKITVLVPKTNNFRGFSRNYVISDHSFLGPRHIKRKKVLSVQSGKYTNSSSNKKQCAPQSKRSLHQLTKEMD